MDGAILKYLKASHGGGIEEIHISEAEFELLKQVQGQYARFFKQEERTEFFGT